MVLVLKNNLRVTLETRLCFLGSAACVGLMVALIRCTETQIKLVGLCGGCPAPAPCSNGVSPAAAEEAGMVPGLGGKGGRGAAGSRGALRGAARRDIPAEDAQPISMYSALSSPPAFLSALAGSCMRARGVPNLVADTKGPQFWWPQGGW